jgi:hypothetical protein
MRFLRPLIAVIVVAAILVPAASADNHSKAPVYWSYDYQAPIPKPRTAAAVKADTGSDTPWTAIAVTLAGVCLLLGAATVLPRRQRAAV